MSRGGLAGRLLLAAGATLAVLGLAELAVRALAPQPPAVAPPDPDGLELRRGMFTVPGDHPVRTEVFDGVVHVNAHGFVDHEWGPRQPGLPRVVVLGDSFVQAAQVPLDDGFGRVLAHELGQRLGRPVEVLTLGVPGAGTATALLLQRRQLPALDPDLVLHAFTTSNDVLNNDPALDPKADKPFFRLDHGELLPTTPGADHRPAWASGPLWEHSQLFRWVGRTLWVRGEVADHLERGEGLPAELRVHDPQAGASWEEAWAVTDALVGALADESRAHGWAYATVLVPDGVESTQVGRARAVARWPQLADWDTAAAGRRAEALARQHGPVLSLVPALQAAEATGGPLYLVEDGHWTVRGHRTAAQATAPFVAGLLDQAGASGGN